MIALTMKLGRLVLGVFLTATVALPSELAIVIQPQGELPGAVLRSMQAEFESIIRVYGLKVRWAVLSEKPMTDVFEHIIVARLHGACVAKPARVEFTPATSALGLTDVSDGEILPFATIECERIRALIEPEIWMERRPDREVALGRALARVLAHEAYHIVCRTSKHTRAGVARSHLTGAELASDDLRMTDDCLARFARALNCPTALPKDETLYSRALDD